MRSESARRQTQPRIVLTWRSRPRLRPDPHLRTAPSAVLPGDRGSSSPPRRGAPPPPSPCSPEFGAPQIESPPAAYPLRWAELCPGDSCDNYPRLRYRSSALALMSRGSLLATILNALSKPHAYFVSTIQSPDASIVLRAGFLYGLASSTSSQIPSLSEITTGAQHSIVRPGGRGQLPTRGSHGSGRAPFGHPMLSTT